MPDPIRVTWVPCRVHARTCTCVSGAVPVRLPDRSPTMEIYRPTLVYVEGVQPSDIRTWTSTSTTSGPWSGSIQIGLGAEFTLYGTAADFIVIGEAMAAFGQQLAAAAGDDLTDEPIPYVVAAPALEVVK